VSSATKTVPEVGLNLRTKTLPKLTLVPSQPKRREFEVGQCLCYDNDSCNLCFAEAGQIFVGEETGKEIIMTLDSLPFLVECEEGLKVRFQDSL